MLWFGVGGSGGVWGGYGTVTDMMQQQPILWGGGGGGWLLNCDIHDAATSCCGGVVWHCDVHDVATSCFFWGWGRGMAL